MGEDSKIKTPRPERHPVSDRLRSPFRFPFSTLEDPLFDLEIPDDLSPDAADFLADVLGAHDDLPAAAFQSVVQIARMISRADDLDALVAEQGLMVRGSQGQDVLHPAVAEARQARTHALAALRALGLAASFSKPSAAGSALASKRWQNRGRRTG